MFINIYLFGSVYQLFFSIQQNISHKVHALTYVRVAFALFTHIRDVSFRVKSSVWRV